MNKKADGTVAIILILVLAGAGWYFFLYEDGIHNPFNKISPTDYSISCSNNGNYYQCNCTSKEVNQFSLCGSYEFVELYPIPININNNIHFRDNNGNQLNVQIDNCNSFITSQGMIIHNDEFYTDSRYLFTCYKNYIVVTNFELLKLNKIPL